MIMPTSASTSDQMSAAEELKKSSRFLSVWIRIICMTVTKTPSAKRPRITSFLRRSIRNFSSIGNGRKKLICVSLCRKRLVAAATYMMTSSPIVIEENVR